MGFRDSNQDLVGFVHQIPERARQRIIDIASTQFPDGGCYHQYQPLHAHMLSMQYLMHRTHYDVYQNNVS